MGYRWSAKPERDVMRIVRHTPPFPFIVLAIVFAYASTFADHAANWIAPREKKNGAQHRAVILNPGGNSGGSSMPPLGLHEHGIPGPGQSQPPSMPHGRLV
jgi:hypothetical protein